MIYLRSSGQKTLANSSKKKITIVTFTVSGHKGSTLKSIEHRMEQQVNAVMSEKKNTVQKLSDHTVCS